MSTVDVIVPCYRYGRFLPQCVSSILEQSGPAVRVLIIDDASPDDSAEVAEELSRSSERVTFIHHKNNVGHIATYNEGIDWAASDYLLLISADDYLLPGALGRAAQIMDDYEEIGFVYGDAVELDGRIGGNFIQVEAAQQPAGDPRLMSGLAFIEMCGAVNLVRTPTAVVRTSLQKAVGGYRSDLPHSGDMEMWLRLAAHASVAVIHAKQAVYRTHGTNMSADYMTRGAMPDLIQRKAAIDQFITTCRERLPRADDLHRRLLHALALDAVSCAGGAFNEGQMLLCQEIAAYAKSIDPRVWCSLPWGKVVFKRAMGPRISQALSSGLKKMSWSR